MPVCPPEGCRFAAELVSHVHDADMKIAVVFQQMCRGSQTCWAGSNHENAGLHHTPPRM
jgi:hypothetical protein